MMDDKMKGKLGYNLKPGDKHYRAFVGPPNRFDVIAAMQFNLLTFLGLREHHFLLDIGCGSLRAGRLFIPYLLPGGYFGVEPERWLVEEGIENELGKDLITIKKPQIAYNSEFNFKNFKTQFDFVIAQSIFSHASSEQIKLCLLEASSCLKPEGIFVATFNKGNQDYQGSKWVYPDSVKYTEKTMKFFANQANLGFKIIDWPHPTGQTWAIFCHQQYLSKISDPTYLFCK